MSGADMGAFWDERAREDAFFFVDNNVEYRATDEARFWADGVEAIERIFSLAEVLLAPDDTVVEIGCGLGRLTPTRRSRSAMCARWAACWRRAASPPSTSPTTRRSTGRKQRGFRQRARESLGRAPRGQAHPAWLGSAIDLGDLEATANEASMDLERVVGEGTQFCLVRLRRRPN